MNLWGLCVGWPAGASLRALTEALFDDREFIPDIIESGLELLTQLGVKVLQAFNTQSVQHVHRACHVVRPQSDANEAICRILAELVHRRGYEGLRCPGRGRRESCWQPCRAGRPP